MDKRLIIIILLNLFFVHLSSAQLYISEKKVKKNKISKQIKNYVNKNYHGSSVKYYKVKTDKDSTFYEAKIKSKQGKFNLFFNSRSEFIGMDSEVHYLNVSEETRTVINNYLKEKFSDYKLTQCRDQIMETQKIYELDVSAKKKKYKFRFTQDGTFIDYHEVPQKTIDLIFN